MKSVSKLITALVIAVLAGYFVSIPTTSSAKQDTCPANDPWVKVEGLSGKTYTYTPANNCTVSDNCYKAATNVKYGNGVTVTSEKKCEWKWTGKKLQYVCTQPDLSHASFKVNCVEPTPTPTVTPEPTPTQQPEPTPTQQPEVTSTPTVEVTPTSTPSATTTPKKTTVKTATTKVHTPSCEYAAPVKEVANPHVYRNGGEVIVKWHPTEGTHAHIYYRENHINNWQHAVRDIKNTGYFLIGELGNKDWTFAIQQANYCAAGPISYDIVDDVTSDWVLFR